MSPEAFALGHSALYNRLVKSLIRNVRNREIAEDLASAAFVKAWVMRESFRSKSSFKTWVYAIALNEVRAWCRRRKEASLESVDHERMEFRIEDRLSEKLEKADDQSRLQRALRQLSALQREVLIRHVVEEIPVKQIAWRSGIPLGTALSRLHLARTNLRKAWDGVIV